MPRTTIKDIAKKAGVSIATVSYVINKSRNVSPDVAERVHRVIDEIGYHPDENARSLRSKKTSMIGLIVPDNANPFFAEIAKGVEDAGFDAGYSVMLCNSNSMLQRELKYIDLLLSKCVDGIILASTSPSLDHVKEIIDGDVPLSVFYRDTDNLDVDVFQIDNVQVGYSATRYLLGLGHRKIAHIRAKSAQTSSGKREEGYRKALLEYEIQPDEELMPVGDNLISGGERCASELIAKKKEFTAIFAANDAMAIGAMKALRDQKIYVPDQVSIVGVDDIILASYSQPPLCTVSQPKYDAGKMAATHLIERIEGQYTNGIRKYFLDTNLVERESTRKII